jgi:transposase-like protein
MRRRVVRYSEAFKLKVVNEIESGALAGVGEARRRYDIRGGNTVQSWLRKFGRNHLLNKVVEVKSAEDRDEVKALKKRIRELEKALADTQVNAVLSEAYYQIVCEQHGITDPDEFKKKLDTKL